MAEGKKSFVLYVDQRELFDQLTDEYAGKLIKHIFSYCSDEYPETEDMMLKLAFTPLKLQLKRDLKKYEKIVERNRINGSKGGRPKKPTGLSGNPIKPKKADNDNDNDTDINNNNPNVKIDFDGLLIFLNDNLSKSYRLINTSTQQKYKARLKEGYTKEDIFTAIKNAATDKFHIDNGFKHLTPEYFSRAKSLDLHNNGKELTPKEKMLAKHNYKPMGA